MSTIYKVFHLQENKVKTVYIFAGLSKAESEKLSKKASSEPNKINDYLSADEIKRVEKDDGVIEVVPELIYSDDTIDVIKRKMFVSLNSDISIPSMYLFGKVNRQLEDNSVFQNLTSNRRYEISETRMFDFLTNINYRGMSKIEKKELYNFDDIIDLGLDGKTFTINIPIGQVFSNLLSQPYIVNPYLTKKFDNLIENTTTSLISTTDNELLMNSGKLVSNALYLCEAEDVIQELGKRSVSETLVIRTYFPRLARQNILSLEKLLSSKTNLIKESKKLINDAFKRQIDSVNLFVDVYEKRDENKYSLTYSGTDKIELILNPVYNFKLPSDVVFKVLKSNQNVPLTKLQPGKNLERLYRVYAPSIAKNGKQIPYLPKSELMKYVKQTGGYKRVTAVIRPQGSSNIFYCEFLNNASIRIRAEFSQILNLSTIEDAIKEHVNPVINSIASFLSQRGYTLDNFKSLDSQNVKIESLSLKFGYMIGTATPLSKFSGCVPSIFAVESSDWNKGVRLRYKRVANYSEADSIEAFIIRARKRDIDDETIVEKITENFKQEQEEAREILQQFDEYMERKNVKVKDPGFIIEMNRVPETNSLDITVAEVSGIDYVKHISIFIDSLMRLTQDIESTNVTSNKINDLCKGKKAKSINIVEDIIAEPVEELGIINEDLAAEEMDDDFLDALLMGQDEDIEEMTQEDGDDGDDGEDLDDGEKNNSQKSNREMSGGAKDDDVSQKVTNVTGMSLTHPNPFFKKMRERDPALFLTRKEGIYNAYSKLCPWNQRRQPVILTQEEKERIDKEHPDSYNKAIKYGSSKDKQFWYICPRYWSLSRNTSLTKEQAESGKYGKIIKNRNAITVPEGEDIFQFDHVNNEGEFEELYPGFMAASSHPDGLCLPCCFKNWDAPKQVKLRKECKTELEQEGDVAQKSRKAEPDNYLMGPDKFPLEENRWGMLVPALQAFLNYNSKTCVVSSTKPILKPMTKCLIRQGVEPSKNQSFIAVIAIAYMYYQLENKKNIDTTPSISEMKKILINAVSLTTFSNIQNGNLINMFYDSKRDLSVSSNVKQDDLYKKLNNDTEKEKKLLNKIINAYQGFISYLENDEILIDYKYLWDLICQPNPNLFKEGLNLVILEVTESDRTGDVEILCPTNHYSEKSFDVNRRSLIIYKAGNYYEPIYTIKDKGKGKNYTINVFFSLNDDLLIPVKRLLIVTQNIMNDKCKPLPSLPTIYKFKSNLSAQKIKNILTKNGLKTNIVSQIINYSGQTVALQVKNIIGKGSTYLPTAPSNNLNDLPHMLIDEVNFWQDYSSTKKRLEELHKKTKKSLLCQPQVRVEEDGLTIGILTETNQLVMLSKPEVVTDKTLPAVNEELSVANSIESETSTEGDIERKAYVDKIKAETMFFDRFRNTIRILLSEYSSRAIRSKIEEIIRVPYLTYYQKLEEVSNLLRKLVEKYISWSSNKDLFNLDVNEQTNCLDLDKKQCGVIPSCSVRSGGCTYIFPAFNLLTGKSNKAEYFVKMADELVRYSRIRSYIFEPQAFLSFGNIDYNLGEDEIILTQSILTQSYLENLEKMPTNEYVINNTYQTAEPIKTSPYSSEYVSPTLKEKLSYPFTAELEVHERLWGKWFGWFPPECQENSFIPINTSSSFDILLYILRSKGFQKKYGNTTLTDLKDALIESYELEFGSDLNWVVAGIWRMEGKRELAKMIGIQKAPLDRIIMLTSYYMTSIDLILLARWFDLPLVLYSSTTLKANDKPLLKVNNSDTFVFVKVSAPKDNLPSEMRLIKLNNMIDIPGVLLPEQSFEELKQLPVYKPSEFNPVIKIKLPPGKQKPRPKKITEVEITKRKVNLKKRKPFKVVTTFK